MVSESDFIAALQAYQDALASPGARIDEIRPHIENHLDELIGRLPAIAQSVARERAYAELDKIETIAKDRAVELAEQVKQVENEAKSKLAEVTASGPTLFVEPAEPEEGSPFTVQFSGNSRDKSAWIGIYPVGKPDGEHGGSWLYVGGTQQTTEAKTTGSVTFSGDQYVVGDYEARLFRNNGYELIASTTFSISACSLKPISDRCSCSMPARPLRRSWGVRRVSAGARAKWIWMCC